MARLAIAGVRTLPVATERGLMAYKATFPPQAGMAGAGFRNGSRKRNSPRDLEREAGSARAAISGRMSRSTRGGARPSQRSWSLFPQALLWAYIFVVGTNLDPFPMENDAYAVREAGGSSLTQIVFLTLLVLAGVNFALHISRAWRNFRQALPVALPILASMVVYAMSTALSPDAGLLVTKYALFLISNVIFIMIIVTAPSARSLIDSAMKCLVVFMLISLAGVFLLPERAVHQAYLYEGAWRGLTSHKNYMGAILSLTTLFLLASLRKSNFPVIVGLIGVALFFIYMTQSKTSLAGLFVVCGLSLVLGNKGRMNFYAFLKLAVIAFFVITIALFFLYAQPLFNLLGIQSDLTGRLPLWALVRSVMERPLIGYGYEGFFDLGMRSPLYGVGGAWSRFAAHAHNGYLNTYVFGGTLAFLCCVAFYVMAAMTGGHIAKVSRAGRFMFAVVLFEVIRNVTEVDALGSSRLTWSLTVLAVFAAVRIKGELGEARRQQRLARKVDR
ncbi:O-antigen ligase family protein [Novosphingobium profundi]|uniref:O-antigen ligase family protein n=1 Tax=Novosphingobium profundi TaxID=1774954 RepID=UPI001CFC98EF|nr:O-antigen ligase family protein [Novosphingobium profundi]